MNNYTLGKSTQKLLDILKKHKITTVKDVNSLTIKQPSRQDIVISDRPVQIDSTELI
jgi:hypothetical protein